MLNRTCLLTSPKYLPIQECNYSLKTILSLDKTIMINLSCNNNFYSKFLKIHKIILRTATYHLLEDLIQIYSGQILSLNHLSNFPLKTNLLHMACEPCTAHPLPLSSSPSHHSALLIPPRDHSASTGCGLCTCCSHFLEYSPLA